MRCPKHPTETILEDVNNCGYFCFKCQKYYQLDELMKVVKNSSQNAGKNGTYIETLILGYPSNPANIIDDPDNKIEIKSCQEYHKVSGFKQYSNRRKGAFKINIEQHKYLLNIHGFYLFVVQDATKGDIVFYQKIPALDVEKQCRFLERKLTKHHYFALNWSKIITDFK
jgi:hypothetical protein